MEKKMNNENATIVANEAIVNAAVKALAKETTSTRGIVKALWEQRTMPELKELAEAVFYGVSADASNKTICNVGIAKYRQLMPVMLGISKNPAKRVTISAGVYAYKELSFVDGLQAVVANFYGKRTHIEVLEGKCYDKDNKMIDMTVEAAKTEKAEKAEKAKTEKAEKAKADAIREADFRTLLTAAMSKTDNAKVLKSLRDALSVFEQSM